MSNAFLLAASMLEADQGPQYTFYCDEPECDGRPHPGMDTPHARTAQTPPDGDWSTWIVRGGRGTGKSRTGAEWLADRIIKYPRTRNGTATEWLVASETIQDTREVCVQGPSGLLTTFERHGYDVTYNQSLGVIKCRDGQKIHLRGGDDNDLGRSLNTAGGWLDEIGTWRRATAAYNEGYALTLRQQLPGDHPRSILTTTPKIGYGAELLRDLQTRPSTVLTTGSTMDNAHNLDEIFLQQIRANYPVGSRLYRQEILGEILEDVLGAVWTAALIEQYRIIDQARIEQILSQLSATVVAVDPSGSATGQGDDTGIIYAGRVGPVTAGQYYPIADHSVNMNPEGWARVAIAAWWSHQADAIVYESNFAADMTPTIINQVARQMLNAGEIDRMPQVLKVTAHRGEDKASRALPTEAMYQLGQVHHLGHFPELEDQMTTWIPDSGKKSPDRLDALVWALLWLSGRTEAPGGIILPYL